MSHRESYEQIGAEEAGLLPRAAPRPQELSRSSRTSSTLLALLGIVAIVFVLVMVFGSEAPAAKPAAVSTAMESQSTELSVESAAPVAVTASGVPEKQTTDADIAASTLPESVTEASVTTTSEEPVAEVVMNLAEKSSGKEKSKKGSNSKRSEKSSRKDEKKQEAAKHESAEEKVESVCDHPDYTKVTLKTATESTMVALFSDLHGEKKFEASDVITVSQTGDYLVVFDNLFYVGKIEKSMSFHGSGNSLIHSLPKRDGDSGFEALVWVPEKETFYVVIEAEEKAADPFHVASIEDEGVTAEQAASLEGSEEKVKEPLPQFHAVVEELDIPDLLAPASESTPNQHVGYTLKDRCPCEFTFSSGNKGFEGAVHVLHQDEMVLMGLCEGNFCEGGKRGRESGNGRLVLMVKQAATDTEGCMWKTVNLLALPTTADFVDYSAIAILPVSDSYKAKETPAGKDAAKSTGTQYHLAVTSQESSQVWIGQLRTGTAADLSDWSLTDGAVFNFPRTDSCEISYCNIEGIALIDDNLLVAVSDKMKSGGKQHFRCLQKDQSIHTFVLP